MNQMLLNTSTLTSVSDAIELLIQKGEGKVYVESINDLPVLVPPEKAIDEYTHRFTAKYTRSALTIMADCFVLVLKDGRKLITTSYRPATTIKHGSFNIAKTTGTAYKVADNVKEIYRVNTTYQITKPKDAMASGIFAERAQWAINITNYRSFVMGFMLGLDYDVTHLNRSIERLL